MTLVAVRSGLYCAVTAHQALGLRLCPAGAFVRVSRQIAHCLRSLGDKLFQIEARCGAVHCRGSLPVRMRRSSLIGISTRRENRIAFSFPAATWRRTVSVLHPMARANSAIPSATRSGF